MALEIDDPSVREELASRDIELHVLLLAVRSV